MPDADLPTRMRALTLTAYGASPPALAVDTCPVLRPGAGQVLVKIAASPVNPSDLHFLDGQYAFRRPVPAIPGLEGSGRVVSVGGGMLARRLLGKRVACAASGASSGGTWAEFAVVSATQCFVLPDSVDDSRGAMAIVNPLAAIGLVERVRALGSSSMVSTAAASALGRMLIRHARSRQVEVINIVRRAEQVQALHELGAAHVLNSTDSDFGSSLKDLCRRLNARVALDAVGGELTAQLLAALPSGGRVILYGSLSNQATALSPADVIFANKVIEGFYVPTWLAKKSLPALVLLQRYVTRMLNTDLGTEARVEVGLEEAPAAIEHYRSSMTGGKVLIKPGV